MDTCASLCGGFSLLSSEIQLIRPRARPSPSVRERVVSDGEAGQEEDRRFTQKP